MRRKFRAWRIWFYGKIPLGKRVRKRMMYERLLAAARKKNPIYDYFTPELFEKAMNAAQASLFLEKTLNR